MNSFEILQAFAFGCLIAVIVMVLSVVAIDVIIRLWAHIN